MGVQPVSLVHVGESMALKAGLPLELDDLTSLQDQLWSTISGLVQDPKDCSLSFFIMRSFMANLVSLCKDNGRVSKDMQNPQRLYHRHMLLLKGEILERLPVIKGERNIGMLATCSTLRRNKCLLGLLLLGDYIMVRTKSTRRRTTNDPKITHMLRDLI